VPIGPYVADFACLASRLIIELDGSQHADEPNKSNDETRTRWLEAEGYRVLRFWNNDLTRILTAWWRQSTRRCTAHEIQSRCHWSTNVASKITPPRRAPRADPPPPGEG